ncbi:nectin-4-like [Silurus meridionalis]|nr:nectin-4-like [Silurus meridionalis]
MTSAITNRATSLLIFLSIVQGTQSVLIEHKTEVNASVGQNISLPCILSKEQTKIIQLQWHKMGEQEEQKLVVFNPAYSPIYYGNVELEVVNKTSSTELRGTILHLHNVTVKDSGDYVCDIATFPDGSIKSFTKVRVTVATVSMEVMPPDRTVVEGDTVNITCVCDPAPDKYMLLSPLGNMIVSTNATLNLCSVSPVQSGNYTLIVHAENHSRLHRQKDFTVTVINSIPTAHLSSTMTMETTPQISSTTVTTPEPNVTMPTSQPHRTNSSSGATSTEEVMYNSTSAPSTGTVTMVHENVTTPHTRAFTTFTQTSGEVRTVSEFFDISSSEVTKKIFNYVHPDTSTIILTSASAIKATVRINNVLTTKVTKQDLSTTKSHAVFIIPFLLVLSLIAFLYRQYFIQKRLEEDEQQLQDNPIYGNIFVDNGEYKPRTVDGDYEPMTKQSTRQDEKSDSEDVSYASLDLKLFQNRKKKKRYQAKQNQTHKVQTHPPPRAQMRRMDSEADCDVALPSRSSSLIVSRSSIYLNSHQVALETEELQRERERVRERETEWELNHE